MKRRPKTIKIEKSEEHYLNSIIQNKQYILKISKNIWKNNLYLENEPDIIL